MARDAESTHLSPAANAISPGPAGQQNAVRVAPHLSQAGLSSHSLAACRSVASPERRSPQRAPRTRPPRKRMRRSIWIRVAWRERETLKRALTWMQ